MTVPACGRTAAACEQRRKKNGGVARRRLLAYLTLGTMKAAPTDWKNDAAQAR